jgi:aerobic carbon-monoxide dehydrogenase medium subunit
MPIPSFDYLVPESVEEACRMIQERGGEAKVLAGGQSLIPLMKLNLVQVSCLVDLKRIPGLAFVRAEDDPSSGGREILRVGALTTHSELARSEVARTKVPLLADTARGIGHPLVRNRGTIGGSLSHCDPSADLCATSLALDAWMVVARADGTRRRVGAEGFFKGLFETDMKRGEVLEEVCFPIPPPGAGHDFRKLTFGHGDFPLLSVSTVLRIESGSCLDARLVVGGVSVVPVRMKEAEDTLRGSRLLTEDIGRAAASASRASDPSSDLDASGAYKKKMVGVFVRRALTKAIERLGRER